LGRIITIPPICCGESSALNWALSNLSRMLKYLKGDMQAALAAYNAGAGNAEIWKDQSRGRLRSLPGNYPQQETRDYLDADRRIFEYL
jgi:soluble lytic murein transglycosylase-like protein